MESFLIPKNIFIGDEAELAIRLSDIIIDAEVFANVNLKNAPIETAQLSILDVEIKEFNSEKFLVIKFKAWETGEIIFPNLKNLGILSELPKIKVLSMLEETDSLVLKENNSALLIPRTEFLLLSLGFIFFIFIIAIFILLQNIFNKSGKKNKKWLIKNFKQEVKKTFKNKKNLTTDLMAKDFEVGLRKFLADYFACFENIFSLTFTEIQNTLIKNKTDKKILFSLEKILKLLEETRFNNFDLEQNEFLDIVKNFTDECFNNLAESDGK